MVNILETIEKLLMIFDGCFIPLTKLELNDSKNPKDDNLENITNDIIRTRLKYYFSDNLYKKKQFSLLDFKSVINDSIYLKWSQLLDKLDVVHQMYLYNVSENGYTRDIKCAFMIELSESLVEIVKEKTGLFDDLHPGEKGTSLRKCLKSAIDKFGYYIFQIEKNTCYEIFLTTMVNSRVNIMHIKRNIRTPFLIGAECALYECKMSLLYRVILFNLLGIDEDLYIDTLKKRVASLNDWKDILPNFIERIK